MISAEKMTEKIWGRVAERVHPDILAKAQNEADLHYSGMVPNQVNHNLTDHVQALLAIEDMINLEVKWKTRNLINYESRRV